MSKKANQAKLRAIKNTQAIMANYTITLVMCDDNSECSGVYYKGRPAKTSQQLAWHFKNTRCKWEILCGVLCRDQQGNHYIEFVCFGSKEECIVDDLSEISVEVCKELFKQAPRLHKLCPFYMASPKSIDPNIIMRTVNQYKVLNLIGTNFEIDCNMPVIDYHTSSKWYEVLKNLSFRELDLEFIDDK